jgi:hypothetical protein
MKYLLDTNVISEVSKGEQSDQSVSTWYESMEPDSLCISVLVIGEIRAGVEKLRLREAQPVRGPNHRHRSTDRGTVGTA